MSKYRLNSVKPKSFMKKYEFIRENGYYIPGADGVHTCLKGEDLDHYIDEQIWRAAHPGQEPIREFE